MASFSSLPSDSINPFLFPPVFDNIFSYFNELYATASKIGLDSIIPSPDEPFLVFLSNLINSNGLYLLAPT